MVTFTPLSLLAPQQNSFVSPLYSRVILFFICVSPDLYQKSCSPPWQTWALFSNVLFIFYTSVVGTMSSSY
jgi:hypothetical protein